MLTRQDFIKLRGEKKTKRERERKATYQILKRRKKKLNFFRDVFLHWEAQIIQLKEYTELLLIN